jgi:outer membrane protein assembly factor BamC
MKNILPIIFLIFTLAACSFEPIAEKFEDVYSEVTAPDYVNSSKSEKLQVPPDLSEFEASGSYGVPGDATSYKDFNDTKILKPKLIKVIDDPQGIHLVKSGNLRWLIIKKDPDTIWPFLETFWENMGFTIKKVNKRMGVMETEWIRADDVTGDNSMVRGLISGWMILVEKKIRGSLELVLKEGGRLEQLKFIYHIEDKVPKELGLRKGKELLMRKSRNTLLMFIKSKNIREAVEKTTEMAYLLMQKLKLKILRSTQKY